MRQQHNIEPIFDKTSKILILGSFPSVKSREDLFFYAHPQNRFWKVIAKVFDQPIPIDIPGKKKFLINNKIALWDVIESCEIENSSDSTIRKVKVNDIKKILEIAKIERIFANGNKAYSLYNKYVKDIISVQAIPLPSTSPANAAYSLQALCDAWKIIK